jgi:predicted RNase H-like nuclease
MTSVAGVDGCRRGWIVVKLRDGAFDRAFTCATFAEVLELVAGCAAVGVDMPVGLVDDGARECEVLARIELGPRAGTIFLMPPRVALEAPTHTEALARCRELGVPGISAQGYALRGKVLEVESLALHAGFPVLEVHPELSFRTMAGGEALPGKRTWDGFWQRHDLLRAQGIDLPRTLPETVGAAPDDVLDAAAVAWTAQRYACGTAVSLPDPPQVGPRGHQIAIWH